MSEVKFKFTDWNGPGEKIYDDLEKAFEKSLNSQKKENFKSLGAEARTTYPDRERAAREQMIKDAFELIFDTDALIPKEDSEKRRLLGVAKRKSGSLTKKLNDFAISIAGENGLTNEEIVERMKHFFLNEIDNLNLKDEIKEIVKKACEKNIEEIDEKQEAIVEEKNEMFELKLEHLDKLFEDTKREIENLTDADFRENDNPEIYKKAIEKDVDFSQFSDKETQELKALIFDLQEKIADIFNTRKLELKKHSDEQKLVSRLEKLNLIFEEYKKDIENIKPGQTLEALAFYLQKIPIFKQDGISNEKFGELNQAREKCVQELTSAWHAKKREIELYLEVRKRSKLNQEYDMLEEKKVEIIDDSEAPKPGDSDISDSKVVIDQDFKHIIGENEGFHLDEKEQDFSHMTDRFSINKEDEDIDNFSHMTSKMEEGFLSHGNDEDIASEQDFRNVTEGFALVRDNLHERIVEKENRDKIEKEISICRKKAAILKSKFNELRNHAVTDEDKTEIIRHEIDIAKPIVKEFGELVGLSKKDPIDMDKVSGKLNSLNEKFELAKKVVSLLIEKHKQQETEEINIETDEKEVEPRWEKEIFEKAVEFMRKQKMELMADLEGNDYWLSRKNSYKTSILQAGLKDILDDVIEKRGLVEDKVKEEFIQTVLSEVLSDDEAPIESTQDEFNKLLNNVKI